MPTLREILAGYEEANAWEREEERQRLPRLSVEDSIRQYLDMCDWVQEIAPGTEALFLEEKLAHYVALHDRLEKAAEVMGRVK